MEIRVSDKLIDVLVGLFVFGLLFNFAYSSQREMQGMLLIPVWLLLLDVCLTAKHMRDQKLLMVVGLMATAYFAEYTRNPPKEDDMFELFRYLLFTTILYLPPILFFCTSLFLRLDQIRLEETKVETELESLNQEAGRVELAATGGGRQKNQDSDEPRTNTDLYSPALTELVHLRTAKDVPGFLFRNLSAGFNMQRGLIAQIDSGTATVLQAWGMPPELDSRSIEIPAGLLEMVADKGSAVLEKELNSPGPHQDAVEMLSEDAFEPIGLFPVNAGPRMRYLVIAGTSAEMGKGLKVMPTLTITDLTGQYLERYLMS